MTYETFFGLNEKPFSLSSDPRFPYRSRSHALAFDDLLTGIRRREGLMVLTGDIGTGKTTLCRAALESVDRSGAARHDWRITVREQPVTKAHVPTPAATVPATPVTTPQKVDAPRFADPVDEWLARDEVAKPEAAVRQFASEDAAPEEQDRPANVIPPEAAAPNALARWIR